MEIQIIQHEQVVPVANGVANLDKDSFRIFVPQNENEAEKIHHVYLVASDSSGMNDHIQQNNLHQAWIVGSAFHSVVRNHPFEVSLLDYEKARSFNTPESIANSCGWMSKQAPSVMADLLIQHPDITTCLDIAMNNFAGGEMNGGFHHAVFMVNQMPIKKFNKDDLYLAIIAVKHKFTISPDFPGGTIDIVEPVTLALHFNSTFRIAPGP